MSTAMLIPGPDAGEPVVGPGVADRLAALGVTHVSLLRDPDGIGIVLEGWAFDPARIDEAVRVVFPAGDSTIRILHEVERVAVTVANMIKEV
ncbi:MAG: hypothetical protein H0V73_12945 [Chloroflexi bacterium]|nr:hypothetical protein [Chloroflexota bacterium]